MAIGPGSVVGGYRVERLLGTGGMGSVYLARHPQLPRWDAIKVLSAEYSSDREFRGRFEREANLAATLDHPNVVSVYNRGEEHGQLWIAMQYVEGVDAAQVMEREPGSMTVWRALHIVSEIGRGLDHAHRRGMLHRDIKPANFLLSAVDGGEERVLLTDFGVAKSTDDTNELTQAGSFVATIAYASPEQLAGRAVDHRADIYGLACSFFKLATGRNPYPGTQPAVVMMGHLSEPPPRITDIDPGLPAAVDEVLAVALAKDPDERFGSCHELTAALKSALEYGVSGLSMSTVPRPTISPPVARPQPVAESADASRGHAVRWWLLGGAAATVVAVAVTVGIQLTKAPSPATAGTGATSSAALAAPKSVAEAKAENPAFGGKYIVAIDISGQSGQSADLDFQLKPSSQSKFFEDLGFSYSPRFTRTGNEPSPRPVAPDSQAKYTAMAPITSGYVLVVRSDTDAGNGGLVNLPVAVGSTPATVIVLDDPAAVTAFREWSDRSERILLEKLVPILSRTVK
ncbi:serine/threonine protein kinase [Nocardia yamanashiensis]|uniref:serine/threonine-protein kinase n=1 Tax=Nocardia yamanashiensis TaxID=209247 RepID=UPI001E2AEF59|nr:serine/threonine-protein kinase [Nocardia yamanashiensis]UGT39658.1 serine/threonine protein kinase [Nocardia yamanashiensis]